MIGNILMIDDEEQLRKLLVRIISLENFEVDEAGTIKAGFDCLHKKQIDVVLCDVKLPDGNGVEFVKEAKSKYPLTEFILLTAYGNIPDGVLAMKNGGMPLVSPVALVVRPILIIYKIVKDRIDSFLVHNPEVGKRKFLLSL
jgi:DNA-binding NtrC family response regulator